MLAGSTATRCDRARGGKSLVARVQARRGCRFSRISKGIVHVFVDRDADLSKPKNRFQRKTAAHRHLRRGRDFARRSRLRRDASARCDMLLDAGCAVRGDEATAPWTRA